MPTNDIRDLSLRQRLLLLTMITSGLGVFLGMLKLFVQKSIGWRQPNRMR